MCVLVRVCVSVRVCVCMYILRWFETTADLESSKWNFFPTSLAQAWFPAGQNFISSSRIYTWSILLKLRSNLAHFLPNWTQVKSSAVTLSYRDCCPSPPPLFPLAGGREEAVVCERNWFYWSIETTMFFCMFPCCWVMKETFKRRETVSRFHFISLCHCLHYCIFCKGRFVFLVFIWKCNQATVWLFFFQAVVLLLFCMLGV